jgi:NAD+-processing family protein with receiver domain
MKKDILLWLDDVRFPPDKSWKWVTSAPEAIRILQTGRVLFASLDHDLAPEHYPWSKDYNEREGRKTSGVAVVDFLLENNTFLPPDGIRVHSMNPYGSSYMLHGIERLYGYNFQMDTKYPVLPWQLSGQTNGWWKTFVSLTLVEVYRNARHSA